MDYQKIEAELPGAMAEARVTLPLFLRMFPEPGPSQSGVILKAAFDIDGKNREHMWVDELTYAEGVFEGRLASSPRSVENLRQNDIVEIRPEQVSDWMYVEQGKLIGGFTIRVFRDAMSESEREEYDRNVGFVIDPDVVYQYA